MAEPHAALKARLLQCLQSGQAQQALAVLDAVSLSAQDAEVAYLHAAAAMKCGARERALAAIDHCLKLAPSHPGAWAQRAALALAEGQLEAANQGYAAAVHAAPQWAEAHYNLGVVRSMLGDAVAAESSYRTALSLQPRLVQAANNLANLLCERTEDAEAERLVLGALAAAPDFAVGWCTLGRLLLRARKLDAATEALERALALDDGQASAWENLGDALQMSGKNTAAAQAFARAVALNPDSPTLAFKLDSLRGAQPARPPDAFVRGLFDTMASDFDHWLVDALGYQLPAELARFLPDARALDVLDLGCGTGLAGAALRPLAQRLEGADLSARMLEKARARGVYDALHAMALQDVLEGANAAWDLLLAADVFVYVGALEPVLQLAAGALRPGGWLLFSIEVLPEPEPLGYRLQPTGRYAHDPEHLKRSAHGLGFEVELDQLIELRREREQMLPGRVMRLRRAGDAPLPG